MGTEHRDAFYGRGWTLRANGRSDLAAREFEQAIAVDPNHARSFAMLAACRTDVGAHERAIDAARTALTLDPSDGFVRRSMGWALLGAGRPVDAVSHAFEALKIEPSAYDGHVLLGEACFQSRDYAVALKAGANAIRLRPDAAGGHRLKSSALRALSRLDESRAAAETALRIEPDSYWSHLVLARIALAQRDAEVGAAAYREALRLRPSSDEARQGFVRALKMRNVAYRWTTAFHSWFFKIPRAVRAAILLAAVFATAGIGMIVLVAVLFAGRAVDPLANLVLRFDRYGRQLLTPAQIVSSDRLAACLLAAVAVAGALLCGVRGLPVLAAGYGGAWIVVAACVRNCRPGRSTVWMLVYAAALPASLASLGAVDRVGNRASSPGMAAVFGLAEVGVFLFGILGLVFGFSFARRCGYPWSHRFDAPSR